MTSLYCKVLTKAIQGSNYWRQCNASISLTEKLAQLCREPNPDLKGKNHFTGCGTQHPHLQGVVSLNLHIYKVCNLNPPHLQRVVSKPPNLHDVVSITFTFTRCVSLNLYICITWHLQASTIIIPVFRVRYPWSRQWSPDSPKYWAK